MTVRRVVPNVQSEALKESRDFYGLLGFEEVMNLGWITTPVPPDLSVEVEDVDAVYAIMRESGAEIVHPLQDEEWGVRRFFVRDPNGKVINVLSHR